MLSLAEEPLVQKSQHWINDMALEAANPAFDVSQASLAQRFKVPRFRLRLAHASPLPWCGGFCEGSE